MRIKLRDIPKDWEDISDILHKDGMKKVKKGQILIFNDHGKITKLKIMRKYHDAVWAMKVHTYDAQQMMTHYGHEVDVTIDPPYCSTCEVNIS
jgi:hypothetical protein